MTPPGALLEAAVAVVVPGIGRALVIATWPLLITTLVKATAAAAGPDLVASLAPGRPGASASARGLPPVIARVTLVVVAASSAPAIRPVGKFVRILGSHVPHGHNDNDEDYHDNYGQNDHELSHLTIQRAWPSQSGASETHAAIDAGLSPLREHPGSNSRLDT
jgi:hypothetical protein